MPRRKVFSRTVVTTTLEVTGVDLVSNQLFTDTLTLSGTFKTQADALKSAKKLMDSDTQTIIKVTSMQVAKQKRAMDENEFIANSYIIE